MAFSQDLLPVEGSPLRQEETSSPNIRTEILLYLQTRWKTQQQAHVLIGAPFDQGCDLLEVIFHFSLTLRKGSLRATYQSYDVKKSWKGGEDFRRLHWAEHFWSSFVPLRLLFGLFSLSTPETHSESAGL